MGAKRLDMPCFCVSLCVMSAMGTLLLPRSMQASFDNSRRLLPNKRRFGQNLLEPTFRCSSCLQAI